MNTATKIWLIVGAALIVAALLLFTVVMSVNHWDFRKLSTVKYVTNTHQISEAFSDITVITDVAHINFVPSETDACQVICYEEEKAKHSVSVQDGCLTVQLVNEKEWYDYIGIHFGTPRLTVALPQAAYGRLTLRGSTGDTELPKDFSFERIDISASTGDVTCFASSSDEMKIRLSTGSIRAESLSCGSLDLCVSTGSVTASDIQCSGDLRIGVSTGKTRLANVTCQNLTTTGSTGDLILNSVTAAEALSAQRSTGDIKLIKCDAGTLSVKTDTGDVTGSLLSEKQFLTETDTGHIHVPKTTTGGKCEITTDTGDIEITIEP